MFDSVNKKITGSFYLLVQSAIRVRREIGFAFCFYVLMGDIYPLS